MRKKTHIRSAHFCGEKINYGKELHISTYDCNSKVLSIWQPIAEGITKSTITVASPQINFHKRNAYTTHAETSPHGFRRELVFELCRELNIPVKGKSISLTKTYNANEIFNYGIKGELTPVIETDGRKIIKCSELKVYDHIVKHFKRSNPTTLKKLPF
jgi:hypothetical protein